MIVAGLIAVRFAVGRLASVAVGAGRAGGLVVVGGAAAGGAVVVVAVLVVYLLMLVG